MISFDTENSPDGLLTLCVFFNGVDFKIFDYKKFKNQYELKIKIIDYIMDHDDRLFMAHNLEYDLVNILKPDFYYIMNWYYSGRLLYAEVNSQKRKKFIDTFNFSFSSLKELGKNINLEKIRTDDFYNIEYCKRDAEITYRYYEKFKNKIKNDYNLKCKKTIAGTSQNILLQKFIKQKIDDINIDNRLLNGYYGGRCEVFNLNRFDRYIVELDFNSMYPSVMINNFYPVSNFIESKNPISKYYITKIKVKIKKSVELPILPFRNKLLYFPVGEFITYATSMEIEEAFNEDQIEKIDYIETYNFNNCEVIFNEFVTALYSRREKAKNENQKFDSGIYKRILNSSYGRFALNKPMRVLTIIDTDNENIIEPVNDMIGWVTIENESGKNKNFGIAAFVTAYARLKLWNLINDVKDKGYIPLYCDTDSCYFTTKHRVKLNILFNDIYKQFNIDNQLGNLSAKIYAGGQFYNAKVYELYDLNNQHKIKMKGIPEKFRRDFLENGITTYKKPMKLRAGLRGVQNKAINVWHDFTVERRGDYKKREVNLDGTTTAKKMC